MANFSPIKRLLIANRGEIACRIIATARLLGISTVAVYSDADKEARHVRMADMAVRIGPGPASESYLKADAVIAAALETGADAVHPGYGFLSENADFAEAIANADLIFVGPPAAAIRAMGSKSASKALMQKAGVPLVPGYHGAKQDTKTLTKQLEEITEEDWSTLFDSNVKGPFFLSRAIADILKETQGSIINIADIYGEKPLQEHSIYSIAKAGVVMMTRTLAKELAPNIRVNGVSPGAILWPEKTLTKEKKLSILKKIPLQRIGETTDIAQTVAFLICNAPYITGQIITVDGGRSLNI